MHIGTIIYTRISWDTMHGFKFFRLQQQVQAYLNQLLNWLSFGDISTYGFTGKGAFGSSAIAATGFTMRIRLARDTVRRC